MTQGKKGHVESEFQRVLRAKLTKTLKRQPKVLAPALHLLVEIEDWYSEGGPELVQKRLKEKVRTTLEPYRKRLKKFSDRGEEVAKK